MQMSGNYGTASFNSSSSNGGHSFDCVLIFWTSDAGFTKGLTPEEKQTGPVSSLLPVRLLLSEDHVIVGLPVSVNVQCVDYTTWTKLQESCVEHLYI